jgi:type IV pilus assembly protein PilM
MISWNLKTNELRPIGLDIGHDFIKMIQLQINGETVKVIAADKTRIDPEIKDDPKAWKEFIISAVTDMMAHNKFKGKSVISFVPNSKLRMTSLRLAEAENNDIEQFLRKEASHRFGLDPEKDSVNYLFAGNVREGEDQKSEYILFATDSETINDHIDLIEQINLRPAAIDTVPCALFRSFDRMLRRQEDKEKIVVFVDIGQHTTTVVFAHPNEINFIKQIPFGTEKFDSNITKRLNISIDEAQNLRKKLQMDKTEGSSADMDSTIKNTMIDTITTSSEDLLRELSLCLRYYTVTFRGKRVSRLVLAGGGAYEQILIDLIKQRLSLDVEQSQPLRGFEMDDIAIGDKDDLFCEWSVAVGLSLNGWNPN